MLIFEVEGTFMCLFSSLEIFNLLSSLLEEKVLILKAFIFERESLISGGVSHLGGVLVGEPFFWSRTGNLGGSPGDDI